MVRRSTKLTIIFAAVIIIDIIALQFLSTRIPSWLEDTIIFSMIISLGLFLVSFAHWNWSDKNDVDS